MNKTLKLLLHEFKSSSYRTTQYLTFHKTFKKEFSALLKQLGCDNIQIAKPNHFDVSGFFQYQNQWWYFSLSDLRDNLTEMLVRTASSNIDYTGGANTYVKLNQLEDSLKVLIK